MNIAEFEKVSEKQFKADTFKQLGKELSLSDVVLPSRATKGSAGYDFVLPYDITINPGELIKIPTGIRVKMEAGYVLEIYPRSSLGFKYRIGLANTVGIIDSDYYFAENEGHIIIALVNNGNCGVSLYKGDRFVQGIFKQYFLAKEEQVEAIRKGGFGSTN